MQWSPRGASKCRLAASVLTSIALALLAGCGGPSSGQTTVSGPPQVTIEFPPQVTNPTDPTTTTPVSSQTSAQLCSPNNPYRQDAEAAISPGSLDSEKRWLRAYLDEKYLWYKEVPNIDPAATRYSNEQDVYTSLDNYFQDLKTPLLTASGKRKDQFSFTYPTKAWNDLSQSGVVFGYGFELYQASRTPPRGLRVTYVETGSVADKSGIQRGDVLVTADGVSADAGDRAGVDVLNASLFPSDPGTHSFVFSRNGVSLPAITLLAGNVVKNPVLVSKVLSVGADKVGYIVFNDHIATSELALIQAINQLKTANVSDLVLDIRYNGGGFLFIADELAYMIAGQARTQDKVFDRLQFNDKRQSETASSADYFYNTSCVLDSKFNCTQEQPLPTLNLPRVFVLTTGGTCSASEAIINGLRGVDVDVRIIGGNTCGKPYGFTAKDNCGISYFPIEFQGTNNKGFGDYADGFSPTCKAADDLSKALGNTTESLLATALYNRSNNACPAVAAASVQGGAADTGRLLRGLERESSIRRALKR